MEGDGAALPLVRDLHLEAEEIAELPLERDEVGVGLFLGVAFAGAGNPGPGAGFESLAPGPLLGLPDREAFGDYLAGQFGRIRRRRDRTRMTHADIALQ